MANEYCGFCGKKLPKEDINEDYDDGRYEIQVEDTIEDENHDGVLCTICYQFVRQILR